MRKRTSRAFTLFAAFHFVAAATVAAQTPAVGQTPPVTIDIAEVCASCTVTAAKAYTLGDPGNPDTVTGQIFASDRRGRIFARGARGKSVIVYDQTGKYVTSLRGPGDSTRAIQAIDHIGLGPGDSLFVFGGPSLLSVYTPDLKLARAETTVLAFPLPSGANKHVLSSGSFLTSYVRNVSESYGFPYHVFDGRGNFRRSFGAVRSRTVPMKAAERLSFKVAPGEKSVWSFVAGRGEYHLTQWALDNSSHTLVDIVGLPAYARLYFLGVDASGHLWIQHTPDGTSKSTVSVVDVARRRVIGSAEVPTGASMQMLPGTNLLVVSTTTIATAATPGSSPLDQMKRTNEVWRVTVAVR